MKSICTSFKVTQITQHFPSQLDNSSAKSYAKPGFPAVPLQLTDGTITHYIQWTIPLECCPKTGSNHLVLFFSSCIQRRPINDNL